MKKKNYSLKKGAQIYVEGQTILLKILIIISY